MVHREVAHAQTVETVTGLQLHPDEIYREHTYEKEQDGYTWVQKIAYDNA